MVSTMSIYQGLGMKPQTPRTKNRFFFIGPSHGEFYGGSFLSSGQKDLTAGINLFLDLTAVITEFSICGRQKKKFSNLAENGTNRLDDIKSGPNMVSDQNVGFLKN